MAYIPSVAVPASSSTAVLDRTLPMTVTVYAQMSRPNEVWYGGTVFRYRVTPGAGAWTYVPAGAGPATVTPNLDLNEYNNPLSVYNAAQHTFAGSTFAAGDYEIQVQIITDAGAGPTISGWSASSFFSQGTPPAAPTITAPSAGANVVRNQTVTYTNAAGQVSGQVQVLNGGVVEYDSGEVAITGTSQSTTAIFAVNSVARTLQVRTKSSGGLWSAWATRSVNVLWVPPATPTISAASAVDSAGLGVLHAITMTVSHPTPSGGQPAVVSVDVYARPTGDVSNGVLVGIDRPTSTPIVWHGPTPGTWQVRIVDKAADGTSTTSAWFSVTGTVAISGAVLHDPKAAVATAMLLKYNTGGIKERRTVESASVAVAGREFPIVEYGTGGSRVYEVSLVQSENTSGTTDATKIKALLERRAVLCYRDKRGRELYGLLTLGDIEDTPWGNKFSFSIDQVYAVTSPPNDCA